MKIKILGTLMLLSVLVCGGGIDSGSMLQFWVGAILGMLFGCFFVAESNMEEVKKTRSANDHSRVAYLR